eukprot:Hpha_TRINITY_DN27062_c0_g1::TRINITY_DN27062_c0_g1_i1::g.33336::m.33336
MPEFSVGDRVEAHSLQGAKELNGCRGRVVSKEGDRVKVAFSPPHGEKAVKPQNLRLVVDPKPGPPSEGPPAYPGSEKSVEAALALTKKTVQAAATAAAADYVRRNRLHQDVFTELNAAPPEIARMVAEGGSLSEEVLNRNAFVRSRMRKAITVGDDLARLDHKTGTRDLELSAQVRKIMRYDPTFKAQFIAVCDAVFGEDLGKWEPEEHVAMFLHGAVCWCLEGKYIGVTEGPPESQRQEGDWECDVALGGCGTVNSASRSFAGNCHRCGKDQPRVWRNEPAAQSGGGSSMWGLGLPPGQETGFVSAWNQEKGFGFVRPDIGGQDLFFLSQNTAYPFEEGSKVSFRRGENPQKEGKEWALEVRPVGEAQADGLDASERAKYEKAKRKCKLYVGQVASTCTETDLRQLFGQFGELGEVALLTNEEGASRGSGFIMMEDVNDAQRAVDALNKTLFAGKPLIVRIADRAANIRVCCEFINGKCIYGNRCRNSHDDDGVTACSHIGTCRTHVMRNAKASAFAAAAGSAGPPQPDLWGGKGQAPTGIGRGTIGRGKGPIPKGGAFPSPEGFKGGAAE